MAAALVAAAIRTLDYLRAIIGSCLVMFVQRVRAVVDGSDPNASSPRYAVYVTYDRRSLTADYVKSQVEALARLGYRVIVISTSPKLPKSEAEKVLPHCWRVMHRRNFGHDFGAYKDGIDRIGPMDAVESLILMNDSCYGPLFDLAGIEQRAQASRSDVFGITDSWSIAYHLQSYFLRIDRRALRSEAFSSFWATLLPYQPRAIVIRRGEIGLTQHLVRRGMITEALCPYHEVANRALQLILARLASNSVQLLPAEKIYLELLANKINSGTPLNPMHSFWDVLFVEFSCPFIKCNLLRRNPTHIPGLIGWTSLLSKHTSYDIDIITRHLKID